MSHPQVYHPLAERVHIFVILPFFLILYVSEKTLQIHVFYHHCTKQPPLEAAADAQRAR